MSSAEDIAEDFIRARWTAIRGELAKIGVAIEPGDVFEAPKAEGEKANSGRKARAGLASSSQAKFQMSSTAKSASRLRKPILTRS